MKVERQLTEGARNLLVNCAGLEQGNTLLIIREDPQLGWYDAEAPLAVATVAGNLAIPTTVIEVGKPENTPNPDLESAIEAHDCTIFFARIGDQERFTELAAGSKQVMCYARDADMLASLYGRTSHQAFDDLKNAVDKVLLESQQIEISCPRGTEYAGSVSSGAAGGAGDVTIIRFPLGVPAPTEATGFSGRIALCGYLTPTGSKNYTPAWLKLEHTIYAEVDAGRITGLSGNPDEVARVRQHYQIVSQQLGIDPNAVHSWHAGIHPGCAYTSRASQNPDRWSNTVFTNPRFLHFHTCGNYAPGEICWMLLDHTIAIDGKKLWDKGRLCPEIFPQTKTCMNRWPELSALFANPSDEIGIE